VPEVRFCAACGTELASTPPVTCASCGTAHWRNPKPCANAIVLDGDRVLLGGRGYEPWKDLWGSPGGFVEAGEHPIETVEREVLEETGLRVRVTGYVGVWVDEYPQANQVPDVAIINVAYYRAEVVGGEEAPHPSEVTEQRWFARDELPEELAPPGTLEAVLAVVDRATPILDRL
jgi:ADP-ribose pyrophosphatase YjhB (NUDIX family)